MAKPRGFKSTKDIEKFYAKDQLLKNPNTPWTLRIQLQSQGIRNGYLNALSRLQKKTHRQLRGLPNTGNRTKDMPWVDTEHE